MSKQQAEQDVVVPPQPGEKLREAREARDLSVADVAARLKLGVEKIAALERGEVSGFTAPVFVAGYLRTYARLLELPEAEVLADFESLLSTQESTIDSALNTDDVALGNMPSDMSSQFSLRDKSSNNYLVMAGVAALIVLVLGYFLWPSGDDTLTRELAVAPTGGMLEQNRKLPMEKVTSPTPMLAQEDAQVTDVVTSVVVEASPAPAATLEASAVESELTLVFRDDSWVEIKDAREQRLMYRLARAGSLHTVSGIAPFMVQLGFVQGVDILYNGAEYDLSRYAKRRSVRLRIGEASERMDGGQ